MFFELYLQVVFDDFVDGLYLVVCLRMINQRENFIDVELIAEFSEFVVVKLRTIV